MVYEPLCINDQVQTGFNECNFCFKSLLHMLLNQMNPFVSKLLYLFSIQRSLWLDAFSISVFLSKYDPK